MSPVAKAQSHQHGALGKAPRKPRQISSRDSGFLQFLFHGRLLQTTHGYEMDLRLCQFVEHAWEEGDSRNIPADARSSLTHFMDALRGHLPGIQRLLLASGVKMNCQKRADPLPIDVLLAMVGAALTAQNLRIALSLWLGFHALLRTTKIHLHPSFVLHLPNTVLLVLPLTKSGQRLQVASTLFETRRSHGAITWNLEIWIEQ